MVDGVLLEKVVKNLRKQDITVWMDNEADRFLNLGGAEATTMYPNVIVFHSKLSASGMYEELVHLAQIRKLGREPTNIEKIKLEIEAKEKLLRNKKSYGITDYEENVIKDSINHYSKLLEKIGGKNG